ncbi:hypothetical protein E2C01_048469 [Portunus trituberculatus]|uniref:Uncharacterized protein n=1 Tax=Portunus trituberculatus TaxID=210409 RepID=A0A5B7GBQ0_PORTR|nr:hypothetical protein [Portunus trituberculatus]
MYGIPYGPAASRPRFHAARGHDASRWWRSDKQAIHPKLESSSSVRPLPQKRFYVSRNVPHSSRAQPLNPPPLPASPPPSRRRRHTSNAQL